MQWTMPHRVLQIVASLLALAAVSSFVLALLNAPQRGGRLPGEKIPGVAGSGAAIEAQDATPLSNERIEGPPPPSDDDEAANDEEKPTEAAGAAAPAPEAGNAAPSAVAQAPMIKPPPAKGPSAPSPGDTGEQTLGGPAAADEPPH
jgi:hypothetical protein